MFDAWKLPVVVLLNLTFSFELSGHNVIMAYVHLNNDVHDIDSSASLNNPTFYTKPILIKGIQGYLIKYLYLIWKY